MAGKLKVKSRIPLGGGSYNLYSLPSPPVNQTGIGHRSERSGAKVVGGSSGGEQSDQSTGA